MNKFKFLAIIIGMGILFVFCKDQILNKHTDNKPNMLLSPKAIVESQFLLENLRNPDWLSGLNREKIIDSTFYRVFNGKLKIFTTEFFDTKFIAMEIPEVLERLGRRSIQDKIDYKTEFPLISTIEEWNFDSIQFQFEKKITQWYPVRLFYKPEDKEHESPKYKLLYKVKNYQEGDFKSIGQNIKYNFNQENYDYFQMSYGLDFRIFENYIFKGIKSGKIEALDPVYLVDGTKIKLKKEDLLNSPYFPTDPYRTVIFNENWYIDSKTASLKKEVLGLAFVNETWENDKNNFKIVFYIEFKK